MEIRAMPCLRCGTVNPDETPICGRCGFDLRETRAQAGPSGAGWARQVSGIPSRTLALVALGACIVMGLTAIVGPVAGVCAIPVAGITSYRMSHR
jgi:uncharacterized membrane protein YvbJ